MVRYIENPDVLKAMQENGYRFAGEYTCKICGVKFHSGDQVLFCSGECRREHRRRQGRKKYKPAKQRTFKCAWCGDAFTTKHKRKYCSTKCTQQAGNRAHAERNGSRPYSEWKNGSCAECGAPFTRLSPNAAYCKKHRTKKAKERRKRQMMMIDGVVQSINKIDIFERDGWRCYICGTDTPFELMGTNEPNAPELEHIIPLSKGGLHTELNVACSCKKCNRSKGAYLRMPFRLVNNDGTPRIPIHHG